MKISVILIIVGILIVGYFLYSYYSTGGIKITCDVSVKNPLFFRAEFTNYQCVNQGSCMFLSSTLPLALTDDNQVSLTLSGGGKRTTQNFEIDEGKTKTTTISLCVGKSTTSGTLRLSDIKGDIETLQLNF